MRINAPRRRGYLGLGLGLGCSSRNSSSWAPPWASWSGVKLAFTADNTWGIWQEDVSVAANAPVTNATADTNPVGKIEDYSPSAHSIECASSGTRPTLATSGGRAVLSFTNHELRVANSKSAFSFLPKTFVGSVLIGLQLNGGDASAQVLLDNCGLTTGANGWYFSRNASNKLVFDTVRNSAGNHVGTVTSASSMTVASGRLPIIAEMDGSTVKLYLNSTTADASGAFSGTLATVDTLNDLRIGRTITGTSPLNGYIDTLVFMNRTLTNAEKNQFFAWNPVGRVSVNPVGAIPGLTLLHTGYDFTNVLHPGFNFKTNSRAGSLAVSNNDIIALAANFADSDGTLNRDAVAPSGKEAILKTADSGNGSAAALCNGVDTEYDYSTWPNGGNVTVIYELRNTGPDNNAGPHDASVIIGGTDGSTRIVHTSQLYDGAGLPGHLAVHMNGGTSIAGVNLINYPEEHNIGIWRRRGSTNEFWINGQNKTTVSSSLGFSPSRLCVCTTPSFEWMKGYLGPIFRYSAYLPNSMIDAQVAAIASGLAVPNVTNLQ